MIFSCYTKKLKEKVGGLLGGPKGMLAPPYQIIGSRGLPPPPPPPPPPPSSYAYDAHLQYAFTSCAKFQNECLKTLRRVDHTILLPLTET